MTTLPPGGETAGHRTLYPVLLAVPPAKRSLKGRDQVRFLSRYARQALAVSTRKSGLRLDNLPKSEDGVPLPVDGTYWSLTHKPGYVGAVVADFPIGIDVEKIRPVSDALFKRVASDAEWALCGGDAAEVFFRYWTAKEAVLKATGDGFKGISRCLVRTAADRTRLTLTYGEREWSVTHFYFSGHIATLVKGDRPVDWILKRDAAV